MTCLRLLMPLIWLPQHTRREKFPCHGVLKQADVQTKGQMSDAVTQWCILQWLWVPSRKVLMMRNGVNQPGRGKHVLPWCQHRFPGCSSNSDLEGMILCRHTVWDKQMHPKHHLHSSCCECILFMQAYPIEMKSDARWWWAGKQGLRKNCLICRQLFAHSFICADLAWLIGC